MIHAATLLAIKTLRSQVCDQSTDQSEDEQSCSQQRTGDAEIQHDSSKSLQTSIPTAHVHERAARANDAKGEGHESKIQLHRPIQPLQHLGFGQTKRQRKDTGHRTDKRRRSSTAGCATNERSLAIKPLYGRCAESSLWLICQVNRTYLDG